MLDILFFEMNSSIIPLIDILIPPRENSFVENFYFLQFSDKTTIWISVSFAHHWRSIVDNSRASGSSLFIRKHELVLSYLVFAFGFSPSLSVSGFRGG